MIGNQAKRLVARTLKVRAPGGEVRQAPGGEIKEVRQAPGGEVKEVRQAPGGEVREKSTGGKTIRNNSFGAAMSPSNFSTHFGNKTDDGEKKSTAQVGQDYNEREDSGSLTEEAAEEKGVGLKSVEITVTTEVGLSKNGGGRKETEGEYLYC